MGRNVKYLNCTKIIYGTLSLIISYTLHTKESKIPSNIPVFVFKVLRCYWKYIHFYLFV